MTKKLIVVALCAFLFTRSAAAVDITLNMNGFGANSGLYVNGPGGYTSAFAFSSPGPTFTAMGLTTPGTYNVDFFHNSGANSSDFSFTFNGVGVTSVSTNASGSGTYPMVTGFSSGATTLVMNANPVVYNANSGQTGQYYGQGGIPYAQGPNGGPFPYSAIPGTQAIDNLYNAGGGNEDFTYIVDGSGNALAAPGVGGGPTGIPNSEYATFSGNQINVRSELVHYVVDTDVAMGGIANTHPILNYSSTMGGKHQEWDMRLPIGAAGVNFSAFGNFSVTSSDAVRPNNVTFAGETGTNDFLFFPTLRYDGLSNGSGFYWQGPGPGNFNTVTAIVSGFFDGNVVPLNMTVTAILPEFIPPVPEPSTLALLGLGAIGLAIKARRRRTAA